MYDCLLVLRAVVQSYVTPQIEKTQFYTLPEFIVFCCVVTGLKKWIGYRKEIWKLTFQGLVHRLSEVILPNGTAAKFL